MADVVADKAHIHYDQTQLPDTQETERILNRLFPRREIRKVLLVKPPDSDASIFQYESAKRRRHANFPPYGVAVLAQHLRSVGVEVRIVSLNHEVLKRCIESESEAEFDFDAVWQAKLDAEVLDFCPDLIGVGCMFTMGHTSLKNVCLRASEHGVPVAIGGVHVTNDVERVLDDIPMADIAFLQEADVAFKKFAQVVNQELEGDQLGQLIINEGGTRHRYLGERQPTSEDISIVPAFDLLDNREYSYYGTGGRRMWFKGPDSRASTVLSNRGCRARCTFCSVRAFNGPGVRLRNISSVIEELELLQNEYGIDHFMWLDDDLLRDHKRAISLFNEMVRKNLKLTWDASNGVIAASCKDEVIAAAADSGCIGLHIGVESGNPQILRQTMKPGTVETFLRAAEVLRKHEQIFASVFLMFGFPGETMSMITDTVNLGRQMDLDWHVISQLHPLPNTPIYDDMVDEGLIPDVGSANTRYSTGTFGKVKEIEQSLYLTSTSFEEAFHAIPPDEIPTDEQLIDIWFYMDYHLNYHRIFTEDRISKMEQQMKVHRRMCDMISPENGFALYFLGYLQRKMYGKTEPAIIERLRKQLAASPYWPGRFKDFGLSLEDLTNGNFERGRYSAPISNSV